MKNKTVIAYLFLLPAFLILGVFTIFPVVVGALLAFFDYSLLSYNEVGELVEPSFVGLENFYRLWEDPYFWMALKNTLLYLLVVPVLQMVSLLVALMLYRPMWGQIFFRTSFYLPVITSVVVAGISWKWVLRSDGLLNYALGLVGMEPVGWLTDSRIALFSVMMVTLWQGVGYYMILYLAGLATVDDQYLQAAQLDGAKPWQVFWYVLLPLLRPTVALCSIISCIGALKVFGEIYMMTSGGPENSTITMVYYLFEEAFTKFNMGYASAIGLVLGLLVAILSVINVKYFQKGGIESYH